MKKLLLLAISLFMLYSVVAAQSWAAPGATWHFTTMNFGREGYAKIEKVADTLIEGKTCDVLRKSFKMYDYMSQQFITDTLPSEYTYAVGNKVYYYRNSRFFTLYDFDAVAGDRWAIDSRICPSVIDTVIVDSVNQVTINGTVLRRLYTHTRNSQYSFLGPLVEKIGSLGYLFPEPVCIMDLGEGGPLRCYTDSSGWTYNTQIAPACDYVSSVDVNDLHRNMINVFPNPSARKFSFEMPATGKSSVLVVTSVTGKEVMRLAIDSRTKLEAEITVPGIYFVSLYDEQGVSVCMERIVVTGQ